jgi:hypothetical protein
MDSVGTKKTHPQNSELREAEEEEMRPTQFDPESEKQRILNQNRKDSEKMRLLQMQQAEQRMRDQEHGWQRTLLNRPTSVAIGGPESHMPNTSKTFEKTINPHLDPRLSRRPSDDSSANVKYEARSEQVRPRDDQSRSREQISTTCSRDKKPEIPRSSDSSSGYSSVSRDTKTDFRPEIVRTVNVPAPGLISDRQAPSSPYRAVNTTVKTEPNDRVRNGETLKRTFLAVGGSSYVESKPTIKKEKTDVDGT